MNYFYAILWFVIGLVLIFSMTKENKIFCFAGIFFLFLGAWWLIDALLPEISLFDGGWGIALRCISGAALVILTISFLLERRRMLRKQEESKEKDK